MGKLGFNGLVVADASHMVGLTSVMPCRLVVPTALAAGCDLFLFLNDSEEDLNRMMDGYNNRYKPEPSWTSGFSLTNPLHEGDYLMATVAPPAPPSPLTAEYKKTRSGAMIATESTTRVSSLASASPRWRRMLREFWVK